jgi:hypothetical protein
MSAPGVPPAGARSAADILATWARGLSDPELGAMALLLQNITVCIERARQAPPSIDRRCLALCITKLEEAEHWALQAVRVYAAAVDTQSSDPRE